MISRAATGLLLLTISALAGCSRQADLTGIWKGSCSDYFGVQIRSLRPQEDLYVVTFCGLPGCMAPGEWMPNSRIYGDPDYEVLSAKKIRIKRNDAGFFTYHRCSEDPFWATKPGY